MNAQGQPSWRDHCAIHPAAAFFHEFSSKEQLDELADDIDKQQRLLDPIHTASVFGKTFVIDGITRLDAAEKTGRQIIDENGNWIGVLDGHVVHHSGKTDEEVWDIVISLNLKRRNYTTGQLSEIADELATRPIGRQNKSALMRNYVPTQEAAAKMVGVSRRSVQQFRKVKKEAPEKVKDIRSGKLAPSKAVDELPAKVKSRKPPKIRAKERPSKDPVEHEFELCLGRCKKLGPSHQIKVRLAEVLLRVYDGETPVTPESVTYLGKGTYLISDVLKSGFRFKSGNGGGPLITLHNSEP
jgi:hypothetical protein